jgi:hypothetical protein
MVSASDKAKVFDMNAYLHISSHNALISHFAFPSLFEGVLGKMAPIYFTYGYPALEAACHGIAGW